jgi:hypothetical protein
VIRPLTIRENAKLLKLSESLRRTSRSISATGRYDLAVEIDRAYLPGIIDAGAAVSG